MQEFERQASVAKTQALVARIKVERERVRREGHVEASEDKAISILQGQLAQARARIDTLEGTNQSQKEEIRRLQDQLRKRNDMQ